jgi:hypothetical protein
MASVTWWHREIAEIVFMFEKEMATSFMDLQVHILIHLLDEVELAKVLPCLWMFFLERYMKKLKGFAKKREKPKGSMVEGYIVYESSCYTSEYIKQIGNTIGELVWDDHQDEEKRERKILQTNGERCLIKSKSTIFCQFSAKKLFTLKLIIHISSHVVHFEFLYTTTNL